MEESLMTQDVIFQILGTVSGKSIGVVTLNVEKALNALSLSMVRAMTKQLVAWQQDDSVACIMLEGSGEKAFCAGGDVRAIYHASVADKGSVTAEASEFFTQEYQLDHLLHTFGKPVLVWGDGIVMGGGLGLFAGASHRVLTEASRIAMPEVTIGLYPDVGGSYFLNRMPGKTGLFLGLTAYNMNAADAYYVGLGTHFMASDDKALMLDAMAELDWNKGQEANHSALSGLLAQQQASTAIVMGESVLAGHQDEINALMTGSLNDIHARFETLETELDWLKRAQKTALAGSPVSWYLVMEQAKLGQTLSLEDCFRWELGISVNCCAIGDFSEGVRALLIDKDRNPQWQFSHVEDVPAAHIQALMTSPWPENAHPLNGLSA
jgi:enoyl-CoA hydratase/carnithine racemase